MGLAEAEIVGVQFFPSPDSFGNGVSFAMPIGVCVRDGDRW
jgi:hypothetical protein